MKKSKGGMVKEVIEELDASEFASKDAPGIKSLKRRGMARIVKPGSIPIGQWVSGKIMGVQDSPVKDIEGKLLLLKKGESEFLFPLTGVIESALGGVEGAKKYVGKDFAAQRLANGLSRNYNRPMFVFDVFTS